MTIKQRDEEDIKRDLLNRLETISTPSVNDVVMVKRKNSERKIAIINRPYNINKLGFIPGQFVQMLIGSDLRFSREKIGVYVGVNLHNKKRMWFLFNEDDGITSLVDNNSQHVCMKELFSEMEKEGNLRLLDNPK